MVEFKTAARGDIAPILTLWNRIIAETAITFTNTLKTRAEIKAMMARQPVRVALAPDFAGFATFAPFRPGPGYAHVAELTLMLEEGFHGTGLATRALNDLEAQARQAGIEILIAGISSDNPRADRFFGHAGYAITGHLPGVGRKAGRALDLILRQKQIS